MEKKYKKLTPRLSVKFIDSKTNELLFEIDDKTWMSIGEMFADGYVDELIKQTIKKENLPEDILVLAIGNFSLK